MSETKPLLDLLRRLIDAECVDSDISPNDIADEAYEATDPGSQ